MSTAIIFDLDGTLADSTGCVVHAAQCVGRLHGLRTVTDEDIRQRIGEPLGPMLAALFGAEGDLLQQLVNDYSATYVQAAESMERPFGGTMALLEALRADGRKLAIATGKSQNGAERATTRMGLAPHFDSIHGIIPGTPGKPNPAVLQRAMAALGVSAENAIMVGDTTFDLDLSAAIGVDAVGVSWGVHSVDILRSRNPRVVVQDMVELLQWIRTNT